jgi:alkanesulfonate monooxygenase SsuD/methylene tetrahydromethanopterin reductase-like flavin-dependent oxidoreductase (luciferase family)
MKVTAFQLMPHRELPDDFEKRYPSVWVDPPFHELADASRVGDYYNWTLDELVFAAESGFDALGVNEHHQNAYGFMPSPSLMAAALARATNHLDVGILVLGATIANVNPPLRIAEEYAMLDCISGGRLIAGLPLGTSMDNNQCCGVPPIEQRPRFWEGHDLILKAWQARETFAWNGRFYQLPKVQLWPRPIQTPHPPVFIPGVGSYSTWDFAARNDHSYSFLSFFGPMLAKNVMDGFWEFNDKRGHDRNPFRAGFAQVVAVADTDEEAERLYAKHIEYFYSKCLHVPAQYWGMPGHQDYESLEKGVRSGRTVKMLDALANYKTYRYKDFLEQRFAICGSTDTVRDQLKELATDLNIGNLMLLTSVGSMDHELTLHNIDLLAKKVLPALQPMFEEEWGAQNRWWPQRLLKTTTPEPAGV